ncbi:Histidine kinase [Streptomyces sp. DvalAA-14]|nr:histidine kinase [Streptomyces sp. SID4948]MYS21132.1 two-component sensor histidine kinase [Streptomyces sp. SID4948]SCD84997.1 Histidine kinase [Streptomyces sp. DvalAA-14]
MAVLWVLDVTGTESTAGLEGNGVWWRLAPGLVAAVALLLPGRPAVLTWGAAAAVIASGATTGALLTSVTPTFAGWGLLETLCLLLLLVRTAKDIPRPWPAAVLSGALGLAVIAAPMRLDSDSSVISLLLTFPTGGAVGLGCYLRSLDDRRRRAIADTRQSERLELARELHDFVAHHVTGIVVQAQAARAIRDSAPEQVEPLLRRIEQAGSETLQSMRKLVRVLREDEVRTVRPGDLFAELGDLVAAFAERDAPATLQIAAGARQARPDAEVETSVRNVVREGLTNIRRHAPGSPSVSVRVGLSGDDADARRLRVEVHNAPPPRQTAPNAEPLGGRGGLGLVGLTERTEAVGGTLHASRAEDGGWRLTAEFPLRGAVAGSPA